MVKVDYNEVYQSFRDLARAFKPKPEEVRKFVKERMRRYNVSRGYEKSLERIVNEELGYEVGE